MDSLESSLSKLSGLLSEGPLPSFFTASGSIAGLSQMDLEDDLSSSYSDELFSSSSDEEGDLFGPLPSLAGPSPVVASAPQRGFFSTASPQQPAAAMELDSKPAHATSSTYLSNFALPSTRGSSFGAPVAARQQHGAACAHGHPHHHHQQQQVVRMEVDAPDAPVEIGPSVSPPTPRLPLAQAAAAARARPAPRARGGKRSLNPQHGDVTSCQWEGCGLSFHSVTALGQHIHEQHVQHQKMTNKMYGRSGSVCKWAGCTRDRPFNSFYNLEHHIRFKHTGEKPHACAQCPARFSQKSDLTAHLVVHMSPEEREQLARDKAESKRTRKRKKKASSSGTKRRTNAARRSQVGQKGPRGRALSDADADWTPSSGHGAPKKARLAPVDEDEFAPVEVNCW